jgi:hypothetical protein
MVSSAQPTRGLCGVHYIYDPMRTMAPMDAYSAEVAEARMRYCEACQTIANLPDGRRAAAEADAFEQLQTAQQRAMRDLVARELSKLRELRTRISTEYGFGEVLQ